MRYAKKAPEGPQTGKRYVTTTSGQSIVFERLLKPFKGYVPGHAGGKFTGFEEV
jgi:hypothetical protein